MGLQSFEYARFSTNRCSIFSDFGVSIQQVQCALQLSFEESTLLYIAAPIAAFLLVPVLRIALGVLSFLRLYGAQLKGDELWSRAFYFASIILFFVVAPTVGALAKTQQWYGATVWLGLFALHSYTCTMYSCKRTLTYSAARLSKKGHTGFQIHG